MNANMSLGFLRMSKLNIYIHISIVKVLNICKVKVYHNRLIILLKIFQLMLILMKNLQEN